MNWLLQTSTLFGVGVLLATVAALWLEHHPNPLHALAGTVSAFLLRVSDERWVKLFKFLFSRLRPSTSPAVPDASQENTMSLDLSTIVASLKADSEAAAKAAGEAALKAGLAALPAQAQPFATALVTVAENPSIATAVSQLESLAPAILSLIAEAEASGVQKAIAAGTVTQAAA